MDIDLRGNHGRRRRDGHVEGAPNVGSGTGHHRQRSASPRTVHPKQLTYELFGALGDAGMLSYIDVDGHPRKVDLTELPWSRTETTPLTVVSGSISAQVQGGEVGCRILVDGVVRDEQSATRQDADVTCRVKSA